MFSIMQTGTECEKAGTVKLLTRRVAIVAIIDMNDGEIKQNENKIKIVCLL